jgi:hypothetical protein
VRFTHPTLAGYDLAEQRVIDGTRREIGADGFGNGTFVFDQQSSERREMLFAFCQGRHRISGIGFPLPCKDGFHARQTAGLLRRISRRLRTHAYSFPVIDLRRVNAGISRPARIQFNLILLSNRTIGRTASSFIQFA